MKIALCGHTTIPIKNIEFLEGRYIFLPPDRTGYPEVPENPPEVYPTDYPLPEPIDYIKGEWNFDGLLSPL